MQVVAEYGLRDVSSQMQAEVQTLECLVNNACFGIELHVNELMCDGPSSTSPCASSSFSALGEFSVVQCIGENACSGSVFSGFDDIYCIGAGSCDHALFLDSSDYWCFVENEGETCSSTISEESFHQCLAWTGEDDSLPLECITAQPSIAPTSPDPTRMPSIQ